MSRKNYVLLFVGFLFMPGVFGQNPIIESGISDPHIRVFNDTIFLYSGHDASPKDKTWIMKDWRVFSTTDLVNWDYRSTISPKDNYMKDNSTDCWAGDAASRNGKYYFFFSDQKRGVGVMTAYAPEGPFIDALGEPLVAPMHDPTVFIDDDKNKTPYLLYGDKEGGGFHIAQLNEDMIAIAEQPEAIAIHGDEWQVAPHWMDKSYIFKNNNIYYLSWGRDYAVSKNIYGPYNCVGSLGEGHQLNEFAHGSFFKWKGQFYHIWCYYIKHGFKYRESIISYCHIDQNGQIYTDTKYLDKHFRNGVGQYNASWDKIEAEWFYEVNGEISKMKKDDGFVVANLKNGDWLRFANCNFEKKFKQVTTSLAFQGKKGTLEFRSGSAVGQLLGVIDLSESVSRNTLQNFSGDIHVTPGTHDVYIVLKGSRKGMLQIDWFKFK